MNRDASTLIAAAETIDNFYDSFTYVGVKSTAYFYVILMNYDSTNTAENRFIKNTELKISLDYAP